MLAQRMNRQTWNWELIGHNTLTLITIIKELEKKIEKIHLQFKTNLITLTFILDVIDNVKL